MGLDVRDMGLGWKSQMIRMNGSLVQQQSVAGLMNSGFRGTAERSPEEMQATIVAALAQMGIIAQVDAITVSGPS